MPNIQEFAQSASGYKTLTLKKSLCKKRGRSCNRREKMQRNPDARIMRDRLQASFANKEYRKEMKQFEKTVSEASGRGIHDIPMPDFLVTLRETAKLAEGNLQMASIAKAAMDLYPPQ